MKLTKNNILNNALKIAMSLLVILTFVTLTSCADKIANPPVIKVFVNGDDVTEASTVHVTTGTRIEYSFEVTSIAPIANLKTLIFDVSIPTKKIAKEVIVGGQTSSLTESVKGVIFASSDTEIKLVVKDLDGNEVAKSFTVIVQ